MNQPCKNIDPWNRRSTIINSSECFHYIPQSGRCSCGEAENYNRECVYKDGTPGQTK
jgi:hypothetical protein